MSAQPIEFFFDFISPYAYLAWTQLYRLADPFGRDVVVTPVLFAAFLDAFGHKGPAEIAPKRIYIFKDVLRTARALNIPLTPPPAHPFVPLLALRCASLLDGAPQKQLVDALFRATWAGGPGVHDREAVISVLNQQGFDGEALVQQTSGDAAKLALRNNTTRALQLGAFGVPSLLVDGELFWGLDSFGHIERRLRGEDPIDHCDLDQWRNLPAASVRKKSLV